MLRLPLALLSLLALLLALGGCGGGSAELTADDPVVLLVPSSYVLGDVVGINDAGQTLGHYSNPANSVCDPVIWTPQGDYELPQGLDGARCWPTAINNRGAIAGVYYGRYISDPSGITHGIPPDAAMTWAPGWGARALIVPAEYTESVTTDINDNGQITGMARNQECAIAVLWSPTGEMRNLGNLPGCNLAKATGINNAGVVVGCAQDESDGSTRLFRWTPGSGMRELPRLPGTTSADTEAISDSGWVAGYCCVGGYARPVVWTPGGEVRQLPAPPNMISARASDINNAGIAVGSIGIETDQGEVYHAVAWTPGGQLLLLPTPPGGTGAGARAINNYNAVAGTALLEDEERACRWSLSLR